MISQSWSWALTLVGAFGLYLISRRSVWGWVVGIAVQVPWVVYAVASRQWGFIASAVLFGAVNVNGLRRALRERRASTAEASHG